MDTDKAFVLTSEAYQGLKGKVIAAGMNIMHRNAHVWLADRIEYGGMPKVLDIGCGGGGLIMKMLKRTDGKVWGVDYSPDMADAAKKRNNMDIKQHRAEIVHAPVSKLPFDDKKFHIVTAFETIQFWPDTVADLKEVVRVMKPKKGVFYIMNRLPKEWSKWYKRLPIKTVEDYAQVLSQAGFKKIKIDTNSKLGWIVIKARVNGLTKMHV